MQLVDCCAQPLREFQFGYGIGEFGCARHSGRHRAGAADRIDDVVVVERMPHPKLHLARSGVDALGAVDDELDALAEQRAVVDRRVVVACHMLVQPDPLDELRARIDQGDVHVAAQTQVVGRGRAGVSAADDDDVGCRGEPRRVCCVLFSHALKTPPTSGV